MSASRPLILLSNDDGYLAGGINALIDVLRPYGDLFVMAPDGSRSGQSSACTFDVPVRYRIRRQEPGLTVYSCSGTPVDCIKLALFLLGERRPQLVISGINHGDNSAVNAHYSGTVGIVKEGCINGIPSIAFSLDDHSADADFSATAPYVECIVGHTLQHGLPRGTYLSVNFPCQAPYRGVRVCHMAMGCWQHEWDRRPHPRGGEYFWLTGDFRLDADNGNADRQAVADGFVAITPLRLDDTDYDYMAELSNLF